MMKINVDRSLPIPVAEQINGQLTYAISSGHLSSGQLLPSVRELAVTLHVAPVTISHVYRALVQEGLVLTRAGVGTFVADIAQIVEGDRREASQVNLRQIVDNCLRQGQMLGHSIDDIQNTFLAVAEQYRAENPVRQVVMVGNFKPATEAYARDIEGILQDLNVRVVPVLLSELDHGNGVCKTIESAKLVITVPTRLQQVHRLLSSRRTRVTSVAFRPSAETRRALAAIPTSRRIGVVATYPEFLQTMVDEVASYCMSKALPPAAVIDQTDRVRSMLERIDVLIYASGCERVLDWVTPRVLTMEFRHAPEPDSVNRLRPLLV